MGWEGHKTQSRDLLAFIVWVALPSPGFSPSGFKNGITLKCLSLTKFLT